MGFIVPRARSRHGKCHQNLSGQFAFIVAFPVVLRGVVTNDEARPLRVVVLEIAFDDLNKVFSALA